MSNRALLRFFALLAAFALIAAACGDDDSSSGSDPVDTEETPSDGGETPPDDGGETPPDDGGETPPEVMMVGGIEVPPSPNAEKVAADDSLDPIVIGWPDQTSGVPTFPGGLRAVKTTENYINQELGGINGHPIKIQTCDTLGSEEGGLACAQEFVNNDSIFAVTPNLVIANVSMHTTLADNVLWVSGGPISPNELVDPNSIFFGGGIFSLAASNVAVLDDAVNTDGSIQTVSLINSDNEAGIGAGDVTAILLEAAGYTVSRAQISDTAVDAAPTVIASDMDNTDATIILVSQQQCIQLSNAISQSEIDTPIITAGTCVDDQVTAGLGGNLSALEGWFISAAAQNIGVDDTADIDELLYAVGTYSEDPDSIDDLEEEAGLQSGTLTSMIMMRRFLIMTEDTSIWFGPRADAVAQLRENILAYEGGVFFGGPGWECPGSAFPAVCGYHAGAVQINAEGEFGPVGDGEGTALIDLRPQFQTLVSLGG